MRDVIAVKIMNEVEGGLRSLAAEVNRTECGWLYALTWDPIPAHTLHQLLVVEEFIIDVHDPKERNSWEPRYTLELPYDRTLRGTSITNLRRFGEFLPTTVQGIFRCVQSGPAQTVILSTRGLGRN